VAERFTRGEATEQELAVAGVAAWDAFLDTYDDPKNAAWACHHDTKYPCRRPDRAAYGDARDPALAFASRTASWATSRSVDAHSFDDLCMDFAAAYYAAERRSAAQANAIEAAQADKLRELIPWEAAAPLFAAALAETAV
jgi:hypothetical protein